MAPSSFSLKTLFEAWKQAEIVVEVAEKRWAAMLEEADVALGEKLQRKRELIEARTAAMKLFQQLFDAITPDLPLDWQSMSPSRPERSEGNRIDC